MTDPSMGQTSPSVPARRNRGKLRFSLVSAIIPPAVGLVLGPVAAGRLLRNADAQLGQTGVTSLPRILGKIFARRV